MLSVVLWLKAFTLQWFSKPRHNNKGNYIIMTIVIIIIIIIRLIIVLGFLESTLSLKSKAFFIFIVDLSIFVHKRKVIPSINL